MSTMRQRIIEHDNDYGELLLASAPETRPQTIAVVVPYYQSEFTLARVVAKIEASARLALQLGSVQCVSIVVVADGEDPPQVSLDSGSQVALSFVRLEINRGRAWARDVGLKHISTDYTMFVDADVLVPERALYDHISTHRLMGAQGRSAVVCGLFNFLTVERGSLPSDEELSQLPYREDFRSDCTFQHAWMACDEDVRHVGQNFRALEETSDFRQWPQGGWYGPWMLPEMSLGGLFSVPTPEALDAGGFDRSFSGYGFDETTLVARLVAIQNSFVIPLSAERAQHIEIEGYGPARSQKDVWLRASYVKYHREFLELAPR